MALRSGYYGLKKKLLNKVIGLPGIKTIGGGLSLSSAGVLSATGSGGDGFPLVSEMTTPTLVSDRIKNVVGGYKQVDKTVYVDITFEINTNLSTSGVVPEVSWYEVCEMPQPAYRNTPIPISIYHSATSKFMAAWGVIEKSSSSTTGFVVIGQTGAAAGQISADDFVHIRGTYEAE